MFRPPNKLEPEVAVVDAGAAVVEAVVDELPGPPNSPAPLEAAGVDDGAALEVVVLAPENKPPAGFVDAGLFKPPNIPPEGAVVVLAAAGVEVEVFPKRLGVGVVLAAGAVVVVEVGAALED